MNYQCGRVHELICIFSRAKACYVKGAIPSAYNPQKTLRDKPRTSNARIYGKNSLLHGYSSGNNVQTYNDKHPVSILSFKPDQKRMHPTQKPVALCKYLIRTYTNEGEIVLDNCMGSGSTGVACKSTNRNFIGIELDGDFFDMASERIRNYGNE
jgi:site-specific DNA-methyltransferase (adenine-specific)